jgi:integrase
MEMGKRANGQGAVYLRGDGRWEGQLRLPAGGRKSVYARTRRDLLRKLREANWMLAQGLPVSSRNQALSTFLASWLEVVRHRIRPSTYDTYELNIRRISAQLGAVPLVRLSPPGIQDAYGRLSAQGLSDYSVLQVHRTLHRALDRAFRWGLIPRNPASIVLPPRPRRREMTALTSTQLLILFGSTRGERFHPLWVLLGTAGLRLGEALGLEWVDVNLEARRISVRQAVQRRRGVGLVLLAPKTPRSRRSVQLTELAVEALQKHRRQQAKLRSTKSSQAPSPRFVFTSRVGGPMDGSRARTALLEALLRAGLPRVRVHDLRHTTASVLLEIGVHPKVVQDLLGHSTIAVTMDTYSHVAPGLHLEAIQKLDVLLSPACHREDALQSIVD